MSDSMPAEKQTADIGRSRVPTIYLVLGLVLPTAITWVYFVWMADAPPRRQQMAFGIGKGMQVLLLGFVLYGWLRSDGEQLTSDRANDPLRNGAWRWGIGVSTGLLISVGILAIYLWVLLPLGAMERVSEVARVKLAAYGGESVVGLALIGLFYSLFHSGFEELYWRGFVYKGLSRSLHDTLALGLSSLGFMSHHVLVLGKFFGYESAWTYVCSIGVATGGVIWGVMYRRTGRLWPAWVSHGFVDATLFIIGYHLVFIVSD